MMAGSNGLHGVRDKHAVDVVGVERDGENKGNDEDFFCCSFLEIGVVVHSLTLYLRLCRK